MSERKKVLFYGPVGNLTAAHKSGGAEAGCRKTIEVLTGARIDVKLVEKPSRDGPDFWSGLVLLARLVGILIQAVYWFAFKRQVVLHVVGFYLKQVYFEWLLVRCARIFGITVIYEIRNGGMIESFEAGAKLYQYCLLDIFKSADLIFCQGEVYVAFLKGRTKAEVVYYPNFVLDRYLLAGVCNKFPAETMRLVFTGRLVETKNIGLILEICSRLKKLGINVSLDLVGAADPVYLSEMQTKVDQLGLDIEVTFHGRLDFSGVASILAKAHYFVFPSNEPREGHSNALTEAMAFGVVPVVSPAGFNAAIVADKRLVLHSLVASAYVDVIKVTWSDGSWIPLSASARARIEENFSEARVGKILIAAYLKYL